MTVTRTITSIFRLWSAVLRASLVVFMTAVLVTGCGDRSEKPPTVTGRDEAFTGFPRNVTDATGRQLLVEAPPERVVAVYNYGYGLLATLGIRPVGQLVNDEMLSDARYFANGEAIPTVGPIALDLEKLAVLEPDLIIGGTEEILAGLQTVAPVFLPGDWRGEVPEVMYDDLRRVARIFGAEARAESTISAFKDRVAAYQALLPTRDRRPSTIIAGITSASEVSLTVGPSWRRQVLDLISRSEWQSPTGGNKIYGTLETLLKLDPDVMILGTSQPPDGYDALFAALDRHPLWAELSAVRNDRVIYIPHYTNPTPHSLIGTRIMLDELVPRIYPRIFPEGPLSDADVERVLRGDSGS